MVVVWGSTVSPFSVQKFTLLRGEFSDLSCWKDPWVPGLLDFTPSPRDTVLRVEPNLKVRDLFCAVSLEWKADRVREVCDVASAEAILHMPLPRRNEQDSAHWTLSADSSFPVKNVYLDILHSRSPPLAIISPDEWKLFWRLKLPDRIKHFLWRVAWNSLPVRALVARVIRKAPPNFTCCQLCGSNMETLSIYSLLARLLNVFGVWPLGLLIWGFWLISR